MPDMPQEDLVRIIGVCNISEQDVVCLEEMLAGTCRSIVALRSWSLSVKSQEFNPLRSLHGQTTHRVFCPVFETGMFSSHKKLVTLSLSSLGRNAPIYLSKHPIHYYGFGSHCIEINRIFAQ